MGYVILFWYSIALGNSSHVPPSDSLQEIIQGHQPDSQKIKILNQLWAAYADVDPGLQAKYAQQALDLVPFTTNHSEIAKAYTGKSVALSNAGKPLSAIEYDFKALRIFMDLKDSVFLVDSYRNLSIDYYDLGDFSKSIDYSLSAIEIAESLRKDPSVLYHNFNFTYQYNYNFVVLAVLYYNAKEFEKAEHTARKALQNGIASNSNVIIGFAQESLARIFIEEKQADSAQLYVDGSRRIAAMLGNEYLLRQNNLNQGKIFFLQRQYNKAIEIFERLIDENENGYERIQLSSIIALAHCHLELSDYRTALEMTRNAYLKSQAMRNRNAAIESIELLIELKTKSGHSDEAITYEKIMKLIQDSLTTDLKKGSIASRSFSATLHKQNSLLAANLKVQKERIGTQKVVLVVVVLVLMVGFGTLYLIDRSNKRQRETNHSLQVKNKELHGTETRKVTTSIIHDLNSPFNRLQGIYQLMEKETEVKTSQSILQLVNTAKRVTTGGKEMIYQLLLIDELEEKPYVREVKQVSLSSIIDDIKSEFTEQGQAKGIKLLITYENKLVTADVLAVTRILQNLVSNALKFSPHGSTVWLNAMVQEGSMVFEIIDQGPGFTPDDLSKMYQKFGRLSARPTGGESTSGLGLSVVDLLVKKLKGSIELMKSPDGGAYFKVRIPF